jgi:NDP-sugar pyrophosphorylase family protein
MTPGPAPLSAAGGIPAGTRAMVFAAGLGTRLKPFTDSHPKALAPVNGKPLLQRNIEYLLRHGVRDIVVNVHHFADQIVDFLEHHHNFGIHLAISEEQPAPLETGGGLLRASAFLEAHDGPFVVMNADILTDLDLTALYLDHVRHRPLATLAVTRRQSSRVLLFDGGMRLSGWQHLSTGDVRIVRADAGPLQPFAFTGVHVIEPALLRCVGRTGAFSIIDAYLDLADGHVIRGYDHDGDRVVDVGRPASVLEAERLFP